jgi:hypothetical protein
MEDLSDEYYDAAIKEQEKHLAIAAVRMSAALTSILSEDDRKGEQVPIVRLGSN